MMAQQIKLSEPARKRLWQAIIRAKINGQARTLQTAKRSAGPLLALAAKVRSGDPSNVEAQAARFYWQQLFGEDFRRGNDEEHLNGLLNYGYAIVRAACARALVGAGLHPSFGLHHHNQYNSFCLTDDLVEPLRPLVDLAVYHLGQNGLNEGLTKEHRQSLLEVLAQTCSIGNLRLPLMEALHHYAASLRKVMCGETQRLAIPEL
jgi:CRISPR-associated protein Cas1